MFNILTRPSWITALSWQRGLHNSVKVWAKPCRITKDGQVMVESSDKTWSTGGGNGKSFQYSCLENPMNNMERQKYIMLEDEPFRLEGIQDASGEEQRTNTNISRKNEVAGPRHKQCSSNAQKNCGCVWWWK